MSFDGFRRSLFYETLSQKMTDVNARLARLQEADNEYFITAKYILELSRQAYDLFIGSEVEGKRHLIKLVLSNLQFDGEKLVYDAHKPFDLILKCSDDLIWRP